MKRVILMLCMAAAVGARAEGPATAPGRAEQWYAQGRDALYRGEYEKAADLLRKAAAEDPAKSSYRVHLARALQYTDKRAEAEQVLAEVLKAAPDHVEAGQLLGDIYFRQEKWRQVVETLEPLLRYRHDYTTHHLLAEARFALGEMESARRDYETAVQLNPQAAGDFYQLGNIYLGSNLFAMAAEAYEKAIDLGVSTPILHYKLASTYFNLRNYFGAISTAHVKGGRPLSVHEQWYLIEPVPGREDHFRVAPSRSAVYHLARAMEGGLGERTDTQLLRANIYLNAGRYEQAYAMFKDLEAKMPRDEQALFHYYFAQAAFGAGRYDEYLATLKKAIELDPKTYGPTLVDAYVKVAEHYNSLGRLDKYVELLGLAVERSPQTASLHLRLGDALAESGRFVEAAAQCRMTLDLEPDHPRRMDLLNRITRHSGQSGEAKARP